MIISLSSLNMSIFIRSLVLSGVRAEWNVESKWKDYVLHVQESCQHLNDFAFHQLCPQIFTGKFVKCLPVQCSIWLDLFDLSWLGFDKCKLNGFIPPLGTHQFIRLLQVQTSQILTLSLELSQHPHPVPGRLPPQVVLLPTSLNTAPFLSYAYSSPGSCRCRLWSGKYIFHWNLSDCFFDTILNDCLYCSTLSVSLQVNWENPTSLYHIWSFLGRPLSPTSGTLRNLKNSLMSYFDS